MSPFTHSGLIRSLIDSQSRDPRNGIIDRSNPWDPIAAFRPMILAAKSSGALCIPQISFPGRQAGLEQTSLPLSASDVQLAPSMGKSYGVPRAMTLAEIEDLIERFAWAAEVLWKAGADGCQVHASHGYSFSQFMAPRTNKRTDQVSSCRRTGYERSLRSKRQFGGSFENRTRLLQAVVERIAKRVPPGEFIISVKLNCQDCES